MGLHRKYIGAQSLLAIKLSENQKSTAGTYGYNYLPENKIYKGKDRSAIEQLIRKEIKARWQNLIWSDEDTCESRRDNKQECALRCGEGENCTNSRMFKGEGIETVVRDTVEKGRGLFVLGPAKEGDLIMEYTGRLHLKQEFDKARRNWPADKKKIGYHVSICKDVILDPTYEGNTARYANGSCEPNCVLETWEVAGQLRFGLIVAEGKSIAKNEEVTWHYGDEYSSKGITKVEPIRCECGELACIFYLTSKENAKEWRRRKGLEVKYQQRQAELRKKKRELENARKRKEREDEKEEEERQRKEKLEKKPFERTTGDWRKKKEEPSQAEGEKENKQETTPSMNSPPKRKHQSKQKRQNKDDNELNYGPSTSKAQNKKSSPTPLSLMDSLDDPSTSQASMDSQQEQSSAHPVAKRARKTPSWHQHYLTATTWKAALEKKRNEPVVWKPSYHAVDETMTMEKAIEKFLNTQTAIREEERKSVFWLPIDAMPIVPFEDVFSEFKRLSAPASINDRPSTSHATRNARTKFTFELSASFTWEEKFSRIVEILPKKRVHNADAKY